MKRAAIGLLVSCIVLGVAQAADPGTNTRSDSSPGLALTYFKQGLALAEKGDQRTALKRFELARDLSPNWGLPYLEIAAVHLALGANHDVIDDALQKAVQYGQYLPRAHYLYGVFLQENGQREEAMNELRRAVELRSNMTDARFLLATLLLEEGLKKDGIDQCLQVVKDVPEHLGCRRTLAVLFEQSDQLDRAEAQLKAAVAHNPRNVTMLDALYRFYQRVGWDDKARATLQIIERVDPSKNKRNLRPLPRSPN